MKYSNDERQCRSAGRDYRLAGWDVFRPAIASLAVLIASVTSKAETNVVAASTGPAMKGADNLAFFADKVRHHEPVAVGYIGGSITVGAGASEYGSNYYWKSRTAIAQAVAAHGGGNFTSYNVGVGGSGSAYGAFRVGAQLLKDRPDLLVVEFAVNDGGDTAQEALDGMEGIVRQALRQSPNMGIVFLYTTTAQYEQDYYAKGVTPPAVAAHHRVAEHYGLLEVNAGPAVHQGIQAGALTDKTVFKDGVHPSDIGHDIYAKALAAVIIPSLDGGSPSSIKPLPQLLGTGRYEYASLNPIVPVGVSEGWTTNKDNWHGVPIWICDVANKPISIVGKGKDVQLIYMGKIKVKWTADGKDMTQELTGHAKTMPKPSGWAFPANTDLDGKTFTIEAASDPASPPHGEVWGTFSIQAPQK